MFRQCAADAVEGPNGVVFNAALAACQRGGVQWHPQLLALFASMPAHGVQPDAWAHSAAIDALARAGQWQKALALVDDLERGSAHGGGGARPDSHVYGAAMRACLRERRYVDVVRLHERMRAHGVAPTSHTLTSALTACAKDRDRLGWRRAHSILHEEVFLSDAARGGDARGGDAAAAQARRRRGRGRARARDASPLNVHCYTAAARAYASGGRSGEATALLRAMRAAGVRPNARTYTAVIASFGEAGLWEPALATLRGMAAAGVPPDGYAVHAALRVCGRAGAWREAAALVEGMEARLGVPPTAVHATTAVGVLVGEARLDEAVGLAQRLLAASPAPALRLDAGLCDQVLGVCACAGAASGAPALALELLARMRAQRLAATPRMRKCAIVSLCRAGEHARAARLLPPLGGSARDAGLCAEDAASYRAVLAAARKAGATAEADALHRRMREHRVATRAPAEAGEAEGEAPREGAAAAAEQAEADRGAAATEADAAAEGAQA